MIKQSLHSLQFRPSIQNTKIFFIPPANEVVLIAYKLLLFTFRCLAVTADISFYQQEDFLQDQTLSFCIIRQLTVYTNQKLVELLQLC